MIDMSAVENLLTVKKCETLANLFGLFAFIMGVITGYCSYNGKDTLMFLPLFVGMVLVGLMFWAVMKRGDLKYGKKVDRY